MEYVVGIGACNVDFYAKSRVEIKKNYDHPSTISTSTGGVTRNVLETIGRLGVKTYLLTCLGDDNLKDYIIEKSSNYVDFSKAKICKGLETSKFIQVFDNNNDMLLAVCDMDIINNIDINYIKENDELIKNASAIIIDPSLNKDVIEYITNTYKDNKIFLDPISDHYASVIKPYINNIYEIKPNIKELSNLVDKTINDDKDIIDACKQLINKGVKNVVVTSGGNGSYFINKDEVINVKLKRLEEVVNASGAGDSFFATLIYSHVKNIDNKHALELANAAGRLAIQSKSVTANNLSVKILEEIVKENIL